MQQFVFLGAIAVFATFVGQAATFEKFQPALSISYGSSRLADTEDIRIDGIHVPNPQDSRSFFELGGSITAIFSTPHFDFGPVVGYEPIVGANLDGMYSARRPTARFFENESLVETRYTKASPFAGVMVRVRSLEFQQTIQYFRLTERRVVENAWTNWNTRANGLSYQFQVLHFPLEHQVGFGMFVEIAPGGNRTVGAIIKGNFRFSRN